MIINENCECCKSLAEQLDQLKAENEKYKQLANSFEADFYNALSDKESEYVKKLKKHNEFIAGTLEKVLEAEVYIYKTYIDKTFTGKFDWENDKVSIHLEKFIKDSIEHIKFIDETNKILYQEKCELIELNKQYKKALQEIKNFIYIEKAKVFVDIGDFWEQILQKCEVINEQN